MYQYIHTHATKREIITMVYVTVNKIMIISAGNKLPKHASMYFSPSSPF